MIGIKGLLNITHPDDLKRIKQIYTDGINRVWNEISFQTSFLHVDGHYIPMEISVRTITDPAGKVTGAVLACKKIIQEKQGKNNLLNTNQSAPGNLELNSREKEILQWLMQGKSAWEISVILKISEPTVKYHVDKLMKKLRAVNRTHAVAIAMEHELIK